MKKFIVCDWLREMQFSGNTVQKKRNWVQKKGTLERKRVINVTFWLANKKGTHWSQSNAPSHNY